MRALLFAAAALTMTVAAHAQTPAVEAEDPFLWLEEVEGEKSLAWVREQNAKSLGVLQGDPRYADLHAKALAIVESRDRIPFAGFNRDGTVDNFWQDPTHVRGIWRRTTLDSYRTSEPQWRTILDFDALSKAENANWVYKGSGCLGVDENRCLVSLSNGGKDAVEVREFDASTGKFVDGGFRLPESKGGAAWVDRDTLLIARDFGPGTLTDSGYPMVVKRLKRGQSIDQAEEIWRGVKTDVSVSPFTLTDADGKVLAVMLTRATDFYNAEYAILTGTGPVKLGLPSKLSISAVVDGRMVATLEQDWNGFKLGDLVSFDIAQIKADPANPKATLILRPGPRESIEGVTATRNRLIVALYENVKGAAYAFAPGKTGWTRTKLDLPANSTVALGSASEKDDRLFVTASNYLNPQTLFLADAASGKTEALKSLPPKFDASTHVVEQREATSKDGTRIPYFLVRPKTAKADGSNPTLLYGYGGYQNSLLPSYSGTMGKLWLERGGSYVVANTRGGGEFGPAWHQAALGKNRQRAHEDFVAVAQDLIARKHTSPRRLGIMGGSQGGLFMGVAFTQHPELFNAAVVQVPLFDMFRFHKLLAGASWMAEYGNPDIPEQRAWIAEYSPYQALKAGQKYPEVFIHTSTKDDRVHPGHARKAAAKMQALGYPVFFYENTDGGHSAAANLKETAKRVALEYTYLTRKLMD